MYIAKKDFVSYTQGPKKKGEPVEFNEVFLEAGLIEEGTAKPAIETKPEPKKKKETK